MKSKENKSGEIKKNQPEQKNQVIVDCVHRTAEWLEFYSSILSDLRQVPGLR